MLVLNNMQPGSTETALMLKSLPTSILIIRYCYMARGIQNFFNVTGSDIIYTSLPLYHTNANVLGIGQMINQGSTVALRKKFSASNFWNDCIKYQCTVRGCTIRVSRDNQCEVV